ncbi:hypothetical protein OSB04_005863 [Centaurea solstitialis]|uniref:Uncharacterized protein n=1 Tax=Centaurea solstitialis TaxID=347529 RepID=A0AA38TPG3_9ASTR|nr:hypothetical protein OSB04_005863 [Centaurea solstitialis]
MDDYIYTTMFESIKEDSLDFVVMNETSSDDVWLESLDLSSYLHSSDTYMPNFDPNRYPDETDTKPLDDYGEVFDDRLIQAIEYLNEICITDTDLLVQLWLPVIRHGKQVLTTENTPYMVNSDSTSLSNYREVSKSYRFSVCDSTEIIGLPSRVFLKKFPMCASDLRFFIETNDPRVSYAQKLNLFGCLNLPIFELHGGPCLGVVEIVTDSQKVNFRDELENICKALEAFDLRTSEFLSHPKLKDFGEPYEVVLAEIRDVLRSVCDTLKLPLAQTWGSCKDGSRASISVIESASYVFDPEILGFYEACCDQQLVEGEGIAGKALGMNQPCFTADIADFCRADCHPAHHQAKMFGLNGAVALRLRSTYTGPTDFVLEFFLPPDCKSHEEQTQMWSSIASMIQRVSWSLHEIDDEETVEETSFSVKEANSRDGSWISRMLEAQQRGENVIVSMGVHKEEPEEEFKVVNQFYQGLAFGDDQTYLEWGPESRSQPSRATRSKEKSRVKTERNISLQVLQQYFPGSLKDAAKSIGVCPTTLKRICRQHGIMRWPSRKIKKVSRSLKKLQLVIDSVQGAEGMIQLGSFYTDFPELSRPISLTPRPNIKDRVNLLKSQTTPSNSSLSSCSHGSSSSLKSCGLQKIPSLPKNTVQEEPKLLVRSENDKLAPKNSSPISQDECVFRVKATFGEEKIRFRMSKEWGFGDLKREIATRFYKYDMEHMTIEYIDDDSDWVLLTCDADLEECMDLHVLTSNQTIKLFLHRSSFMPMIHPNDDGIHSQNNSLSTGSVPIWYGSHP